MRMALLEAGCLAGFARFGIEQRLGGANRVDVALLREEALALFGVVLVHRALRDQRIEVRAAAIG